MIVSKLLSIILFIRMQNQQKPYHQKSNQFLKTCGQALIQLQKLKLFSYLQEFNMSKIELSKYFNYYLNKSKKRVQFSSSKIQQLNEIFENNSLYLQGLELRTVNNMLQVFRKRIKNQRNGNSYFGNSTYMKNQKVLFQAILSQDSSQFDLISNFCNQLKKNNQKIASEINNSQDKKQQLKTKKIHFQKALKLINKAQVQYYRYFESFQRSIANMVNQLHSHMEKLSQFFTVWQNYGSSLIYEKKTSHQILIDKTLQQKRGLKRIYDQQNQQQIRQIIQTLPQNSKLKDAYIQRLEQLKNNNHCLQNLLTNTSFTYAKPTKTNYLVEAQSLSKKDWYETEDKQIKQYSYSDHALVKQKQQGYFRYTYEQLHRQTVDYLNQVRKGKKGFSGNKRDLNIGFDRFYTYCEKRESNQGQGSFVKPEKCNVPNHMTFGCWHDRIGPKGWFNIQDFPMNLVQRKLQYEYDRQAEMQHIHDKKKKQYNSKNLKLLSTVSQDYYNIGHCELNSLNELEKVRKQLISLYDTENLPNPKNKQYIQLKKQIINQQEFSSQDECKDINQKKSIKKQPQVKKLKQRNQKGSLTLVQQFLQQTQQILKTKNPKMHKQQEGILKQSISELKKAFPWLQTKQISQDPLQIFTQTYLLQYQKATLRKMKAEIQKLGYSEQESQPISFVFLENFQIQSIKKCLRISSLTQRQNQSISYKENICKMYLINRAMLVKVQPLFFHNRGKILKLQITLTSQFPNLQKLKQNLQKVLSQYGKCAFNFNLDLISQQNQAEKLYALIGVILKNIRQDKNLKNILSQKQLKIDVMDLTREGKKIFESFLQNYQVCKKLDEVQK